MGELILEIRGRRYDITRRPLLVGILNVTPDSFSDGGKFFELENAMLQARRLVTAGADVIDLGGESTRPGAAPVDADEEAARVLPVIDGLRKAGIDVPISIDTQKARIAEKALNAGADLVNDVSGLEADPAMARVLAERGVPLILMHHRGNSQEMYAKAHYEDVVAEVRAELQARVETALAAGVRESSIVLDPGFGFAKRAEHSWRLLDKLSEICALGRPVMTGTSRKSFLKEVFGDSAEGLERGTIATSVAAVHRGARLLRVHEPAPFLELDCVGPAPWSGGEKG